MNNGLVDRLEALPRSERWSALTEAVVTECKTTLLMNADELLPLNQSYFEFGLTSLGLVEIKERLQEEIGQTIDPTALFNNPTVNRLVEYLALDLLSALFDGPPEVGAGGAQPSGVDDLLDELYPA